MRNKILIHTLAVLVLGGALHADVLYTISVNTSAIQGTSGFIDLQLGSGPDSQSATVTIQSFSSNGTLSAATLQANGAASGTLPGTVTLGNGQQFNDYFEGFVYGTTLSFAANLSGPALNAPNGSSQNGSPFFFGLYNAQQLPAGASDAFGNALLIQINPNGTTAAQVFNPAVSVTGAAAPEPATWCLVVGSLSFAILRRRASA